MGGIAKGVHDSSHIIADTVVELYDIALGNAKEFSKSAIAIDTYANAVLADMLKTTAAVAAMTAGNMTFARHAVAHFDVAHPGANLLNDANIFVADCHRRLDSFLTPFVPFINMEVCSTDCGLADTNQHVVHTHLGYGNVFHPDAFLGFFLY